MQNVHVMASLRRPENTLLPLPDLVVDGEAAICASIAIGTPRASIFDGDEPLVLTPEQDPRGVVQQYLARRDMVMLDDNGVDYYLASHEEKCVRLFLFKMISLLISS